MNWRSKGAAVASHSRGPVMLRAVTSVQLQRLDALIQAATAARGEASKGVLFASYAGKDLVEAAHTLFQVDGLHALLQDVAHELGEDGE